MGYDEKLAMRIRGLLAGNTDITERKMFGGLSFLYKNRMSCGIVHRDLVVRVPDDQFEAVVHMKYVRPMDFTGRPLKNFVYVSPPGFRTAIALRKWLDLGLRFVGQVPKKPARNHRQNPGANPGAKSGAKRAEQAEMGSNRRQSSG
jgi:hypothetical protein